MNTQRYFTVIQIDQRITHCHWPNTEQNKRVELMGLYGYWLRVFSEMRQNERNIILKQWQEKNRQQKYCRQYHIYFLCNSQAICYFGNHLAVTQEVYMVCVYNQIRPILVLLLLFTNDHINHTVSPGLLLEGQVPGIGVALCPRLTDWVRLNVPPNTLYR